MSLLEIIVSMIVIGFFVFAGVERWTRVTRTAEFESDLKVLSAAAHAWSRQHCGDAGFGADRTVADVGADISRPGDWTVAWAGSDLVLRYGGTDRHHQQFLLAKGGARVGATVEIRPALPSAPVHREHEEIRRILWGNAKC